MGGLKKEAQENEHRKETGNTGDETDSKKILMLPKATGVTHGFSYIK